MKKNLGLPTQQLPKTVEKYWTTESAPARIEKVGTRCAAVAISTQKDDTPMQLPTVG